MSLEEKCETYVEIIKLIRTLWQKCRMVHGDLSPYNLLYYKDKIVIIDVSQSVEDDHPFSLDFLKRDIRNINHAYKSQGVYTFSLKGAFDFVVDKTLSAADEEAALEKLKRQSLSKPETPEEEEAFMLTDIHRSLKDIPIDKLEEELLKLQNDPQSIYYAALTGISHILPKSEEPAEEEEDDEEEGSGEEEQLDQDEQFSESEDDPDKPIIEKAGKEVWRDKPIDSSEDDSQDDEYLNAEPSLKTPLYGAEKGGDKDGEEDESGDEEDEDDEEESGDGGKEGTKDGVVVEKDGEKVEKDKAEVLKNLENKVNNLGEKSAAKQKKVPVHTNQKLKPTEKMGKPLAQIIAEQEEAKLKGEIYQPDAPKQEAENPESENQTQGEESIKKGPNYDPFEGMTKAERKKKVKEEKREKRETKMPKKDKKKLVKKTKH
jgi:RIO kinase 1